MKDIENWGHWYDRILNSWPFCLDRESINTVGLCLTRDWKIVRTGDHQFYNPYFIRIGLPFALFIGIRLTQNRLFQCGVGWKQNGRFAILCRLQTDQSAAEGTHSPNPGQATGWDYGEH